MKVTDSDRIIDRALNLHEEGRILEVDASPLPEFELERRPRRCCSILPSTRSS